jgi:hypothetical protein
VVDGALPDGLRLEVTTGVINGTPLAAGAASFMVRVSDSDTPSTQAEQAFTLSVGN